MEAMKRNREGVFRVDIVDFVVVVVRVGCAI